MTKYKICYGNKCFSKKWKNDYVTWDAFCERLKVTHKTIETVEEYVKLPKAERDKIKDIGGFVAGHIVGERRKKENVLSRSMITLDMDSATPEFINEGLDKLEFTYCVYSTHKHTKENPRLRLIIPLARDVSAEEYGAISRMVAQDIGMDMMDKTTFEANRMMYWPSTSSNGEYFYKRNDKGFLAPDEVLKEYDDWHEVSTWPLHPDEMKVQKEHGDKKKDPLEADGIVGAFCRSYTIAEVMDKYLSDVYAATDNEERYDYIPADSSAGVIVYEDKFVYSHHATDPASGKLMNAFELVMAHKFKDLDEKEQFKKMSELALEDEKVRIEITNTRLENAKEEFNESAEETDDSWKGKLQYEKNGQLVDSTVNLQLILEHDPIFANVVKNELAGMVEFIGPSYWTRDTTSKYWNEADEKKLKGYLDANYQDFSNRNYDVAFSNVVVDRIYHPIRKYLNELPQWDGIKRVEELFIKYMQAEDSDYIRTVTRKTFVAMVARAMRPGTKFDAVPVLDGAQGIGKSTIVKDLIGDDYYSDALSLTDMSDKTGAEKLQGFWCVEIGELAGMKKADIEKVKAFVTTTDDHYRPSYGKVVESHPRQCVIIATINGENGYLRDITGNRRFWIIKLHQTEKKRMWKFDKYFKDQFWAEAKFYYEQGEELYLTGDIAKTAEEKQTEAMEVDARQGMLMDYLDRLLPENWNEMTLYQRRDFLEGDPTALKGTVQRKTVSNIEIYSECFGGDPKKITRADSYSITSMMIQCPGWKKTDISKRIPIYGKQRLYQRK